MPLFKWLDDLLRGRPMVVPIILLLAITVSWMAFGGDSNFEVPGISGHNAVGTFFGRRPAPVEPSIIDPATELISPKHKNRLMTIHHIPRIRRGAPTPHPFVGDCKRCHLYVGGAPGLQPKTPVGAVLEELSKVKKLGPPLRPTSILPHPPAGRCIKCHDIVVKVPIKKNKNSYEWVF